MKRLSIILLASCCLCGLAKAGNDEARLLRFPSTNGQEVVFSYAGDLYKAPLNGGEAQRLTSHIGYEMFARYSPDGKQIAFTGQYDGNTEVYLIPAQGGEPVRLTYTSTNSRDDLGDRMGPNNIVMTWTPDGQQIVFRNRIGTGYPGTLMKVSPEGGMPEAIPLPEGGFCSYSPDGSKLAYNRVFREFRTWKYYRGGMADDIWVYDPAADTVINITRNEAQDIFPMWIGDEIFFLSDRDLTMNLFAYNTKTKATEKVTDFKDYDIKFPSSDGKIIVFEKGGFLFKFDPAARQCQKIEIRLASDNIYARSERKNVAGNITAASLSPDGSRLAVTARGEVFDIPAEEGVTRNLSRTPGAHERNAAWSPDGQYIAYISDRSGETELYMEDLRSGELSQLTRDNDTYIRDMQWSPDSKKLLYTDRENRIVLVDIAAKSKETVMQNPAAEFTDVSFSPDSRWLTYTKPASNQMGVVYVYNLDSKEEFPITEKWYRSDSPVFSSDGKYLIFNSDRDYNPIYGSMEWNHVFTKMGGIYIALLQNDTPSPFLDKDAEVEALQQPANNTETGKKKSKAKQDEGIRIDTAGIQSRILKLPLPAGYYSNFISDGNKIWYNQDGDTRVYDLQNQEDALVAEMTMMDATPDLSTALLYQFLSNRIYVMPMPSGQASLNEAVPTDDMIALVDYEQEWPQIFDEAWRAYRDGFYLENMHGVDWNAIKDKYSVLVPYAKTRLDLNYIIGEMIGELACGHAYVNPGEYAKPERLQMGLLGAELSRDESGFFRIDKIIPGAPYSQKLRSPLTEPGLDVKAGDYITAIDGIPLTETNNIYELLVGKAGVMTELSINSEPKAEGSHKIVVSPIADEYPLYHYNWIQNNIRKVDSASGGRVGYIYIPDMGPEGLTEFARYFYPQLDKEGLIIDDRANGGGNVSPMIIERLLRQPYRLTMGRGTDQIGTIPDATQYGPKVLLINKYSSSDGDLFPWSFKANKIGTIIGTRSWGGIIGISGSLPYMDGTDIRVPFFTNYDAKTGQWIVENHGVDPDILLDNDPIKEQAGIDQQLNKAIETVMEQLKDRKPLPGVPAPRTFKDLHLPE